MSFQKVAEKLNEIGNYKTLEAHLDTLSTLFYRTSILGIWCSAAGYFVPPHKSRHQGG